MSTADRISNANRSEPDDCDLRAEPDDPNPGEADDCEPPLERDGHTKALAELARDHHRALLRFLTARTGSQDEALEVAQEAYAKMLALDHPETVGFLAGYMWKIAGNLANERKRQRANRARLDLVALFEPEKHAQSAEALVYTQQRLELLEKAINELPPKCLEAFVLRVIEEQSFKEVAQRMDIGERMAMIYVARALEYCQSCLDAAEATRRMPK
jgi:RNA polymerase sigma factor (sigma-70 family)